MPRDLKIIDIFISSPSDVGSERQLIVELAREWNSLNSKAKSAHINVLTWEDAVAPAIGDRPQDVINQQIGDEYDVYIGVMWSRFGSHTGKAESGTIEEFERALERYKVGGGLRLAMLFKSADIPMSMLDGAQYAKVQNFKKSFAEQGGLYREFRNDDEIRLIVNRIFNQVVEQFDFQERDQPRTGEISTISSVDKRNDSEDQGEYDDEPGFLEIQAQLTAVAEKQAVFMSGWSELMEANTLQTSEVLDDLNTLGTIGQLNPQSINKNMAKIAASLDSIPDYLISGLPSYIEGNDDIARLMMEAVDVAGDFSDTSAVDKLKADAADLKASVSTNYAGTVALNVQLQSVPRLSGIFNKSRNKIMRVHGRLIDENRRLESILDQIVAL